MWKHFSDFEENFVEADSSLEQERRIYNIHVVI